jgi:uncharacterized membrane protein YvbJ
MKKCPKCGAENKDDVLYCSQCGSKFDQIPAKAPQKEPVSAPAKRWSRYETLTIVSLFLGITQIFAPVGLTFSILGIIRSKKLKGMAIASTIVCSICTIALIAAFCTAVLYQLNGGNV